MNISLYTVDTTHRTILLTFDAMQNVLIIAIPGWSTSDLDSVSGLTESPEEEVCKKIKHYHFKLVRRLITEHLKSKILFLLILVISVPN